MDDETNPGEGPGGGEPYPAWQDPVATPPSEATARSADTHEPDAVPEGAAGADVVGTVGEEPEGPPRSRLRAGRWIVAGVAGLFVLAGAGIGIKLFALRGTSDVLQQMVPADADVYATAYLDPSLSQKLHLRTLVRKFPALNGRDGIDRRIDDLLGQAFEGSGLDFKEDVSPWLGTQLGVVVRIDDAGPHPAVLVSSTNDAAAEATLAKLRQASTGSWTDSQHDGVAVASGQDRTGGPLVYAYLDHTAILSEDRTMVESVIDADRGGKAGLAATADFSKAQEGLPKDRLAFVYVNSGRLLDRYLTQFDQGSGLDLGVVSGPFSGFQAYRSVGAAVSAESSGVAVHVSVAMDSSKLTSKQRAALEGPAHRNTVIEWTPKDALGLMAFSRFGDTLKGFVDGFGGSDPQVQDTLLQLGVSGPDGLIAHMTGDAGLTATAATQGSIPDVAFLVGTDDAAASGRVLANLKALASQAAGAFTGAGPTWQVESYDAAPYGAVQITWLDDPDLRSMGLEPAYATVKDMTILGSSRAAVKAALDAHGGAGDISTSPTFTEALGGSEADADMLEYFDVQGIAQAVAASLSPDERARFEADVKPNLEAVRAFAATQAAGPERSSVRVFVLIR